MKERHMEPRPASRSPAAALIARLPRVKAGIAVAAAVVVALMATQALLAGCIYMTHGVSYSSPVPCQNSTCAYWETGIPPVNSTYIPPPACLDPAGLTIIKVTVSVTATAWSRCQTGNSSSPSCRESNASCADYWMYADNACTIQCMTASNLPTYCKGP
jgi:hypothetical protein